MNMSADQWRSHPWRLIRGEPMSPVMQMALDEVLTDSVAAGTRPPTVRFWEWTAPAAVLGRFQSVRNEVDEAAARRHGVEVVRRVSGGGTMFIEPAGAITYSIYAPSALVEGLSFIDSYALLDAWVLDVLRSLGIEVWYEPVNSMMCAGGKIAGAAQARRGGVILHHTTIAYDMDHDRLHEVLRLNRERVSAKGVASVVRPVSPLRRQTDRPRLEIVERLVAAFADLSGARDDRLTAAELDTSRELANNKFGTPDWLYALP
jgi:lipoate-protein ligase A